MNIIDTLMGMISPTQTTGIAQDRFTRTPMFWQPMGGAGQAQYMPEVNWGQMMAQHGLAQAGIDPSMKGAIQIGYDPGGGPPGTTKHEIIHAATMGALQPGSDLYKQVQRAIPDQVNKDTDAMYKGQDYDPVHEGVARFLTSDFYSDPKWNKQKLELLNSFPTPVRGKLTRILGVANAR